MKGVQKWTDKKIKYRRYIKEYYDADTGEQLTEEQFENYTKLKTEYIKNYAGHIATTYRRTIGRKKNPTRNFLKWKTTKKLKG